MLVLTLYGRERTHRMHINARERARERVKKVQTDGMFACDLHEFRLQAE